MADGTLAYLGAGFGVAWLAIAAYVVRLARLERSIARRLEEIDRTSRPPAAG